MDLIDRLLDNDYRSKRNLLLSALRLTAAQLDAPLLCRVRLEPWWEPDGSLRQVLDRLTDMVWVAEMLKTIGWSHSGEGWTLDGQIRGANTIEEMIDRLDCFYKEYLPFVQYVKENDLWETTWVDAACEPAETFTYATVIEYGIERGIFRRFIAQGLLEQSGVAIR